MHHTYQTLHNWQRPPWLWLKGSWENSSGWEELSIINKSHVCTQRAVLTQTKHSSPSEVSALCSVNRKITCPTLQIKMLRSKGDRIITYSNYHSQSLENSPSGWIHLYFCPCTWTGTEQSFAKDLLCCLCFILKGSFTLNYLTTVLEVAMEWFLQYTRIPSSRWLPLQPEESSSQDAGGAPHRDPLTLGCLWAVWGINLLSVSPLWFYWSSISLAVPTRRKQHKFLPTATFHSIRFQQLAASSSCRFTSWCQHNI